MAFSLVVELLNMRFRKKAKVAAPSSPKLDGSSSSP
jgi:hypothetical protein